MDPTVTIRDASAADAAACAHLNAPCVLQTAISFEEEAPSPAEMARRIAAYADRHASSSPSETLRCWGSPMAAPTASGRALYAVLLPRLPARGYQSAYAGATQPNPASIALHRAMDFQVVETYRRVGYTFGAWHDVLGFASESRRPG